MKDRGSGYLGVVGLLASAGIYFFVVPRQIYVPPDLKISPALSPDFFPRLVLVVLGLLSLTLALQSFLFHRPGGEGAPPGLGVRGMARVGAALLIFFAYFSLIGFLGWPLASVLILAFSMWYFGWRNWLALPAVAVLFPLILLYFFEKVAQVPLPRGILFD